MDMIFIPNYKNKDGASLIKENQDKFISLMLIFGQINLLKLIVEELNIKTNFPLNNYRDRTFY